MAGVKGRSGGARSGAGRKPAPARTLEADSDDAMEFLRLVMREKGADAGLRVRAAIELARLERAAPPGTLGKKSVRTKAAQDAAAGSFAPGAPPKLVVNNE